jgi:cytoskeleton protein RodZ
MVQQDIMAESVGEQLKTARLERKFSLDQVFLATHIRVRYLEALENDQRELLPSEVQGKGFLRLYADYLGMPVTPLLAAWEENKLAGSPVKSTPVSIVKQVLTEPSDVSEVIFAPPDKPTAEVIFTPSIEPLKQSSPDAETLVEEQAESIIISPPEAPVTESQNIYIEIGKTLRAQREALGLSLPDSERYTHVRMRYIEALEDGRMEDLPSLVQGRGMLNNYAHFLELDTDILISRFADALQARRVEHAASPPKTGLFNRRHKATSSSPVKRLITPDLLIGAALILILFVFAIWSAVQVSAINNSKLAATAPPMSEVLLNSTATPLVVSSETATPRPVSPLAGNAATNVPGSTENTGGETSSTLPVLGNNPLQLYIVAHQRTWVQVLVDGKVSFNGLVTPGTAYPFSATKKIELLTGNAAAIQAYYNQNDLGTLGLQGQVVGLIFDQAGIQTPTPAFTATATVTQQATVTSLPSPTIVTPTITPFIP